MLKPMHELNQAERLARREHRRQTFSPDEIASLEAEDERELKVAASQALAECRTRYDACRKHGEPLYTGWCKACAAEAITRAKDQPAPQGTAEDHIMIENEEQLHQTRLALEHLEAGLASLKREVLPLNQARFALMAEPVVDQIRELRTQIDEYS